MVGAFSYSGQICIHAQRFYVHPDLYDEFLRRMKTEAKKLTNGDPLKKDTKLSAMIDEHNARRVEEWVSEAIERGAKLVCHWPPGHLGRATICAIGRATDAIL